MADRYRFGWHALLFPVWTGIACGTAMAQAEKEAAQGIQFSGYYKNLLVRSETVFPSTQPYLADLNRLRIEVKGQMLENIAFEVQYDNEAYLGNYLQTAQFRMQRDLRPNQYWRLDKNYLDTPDIFARHNLYRAFATWSKGETDVLVGRQRIAWGTGRFFSPLDRLNPITPTALERDERAGVDAILIERKLGPVSRFSAVYAPQHNHADDTLAMQWHGNTRGIDWSLVGGRFLGDRMIGMDIATQLGDAGLRGELTRTLPKAGSGYTRAVLGFDYAFPNTATITAELYYNGGGATNAADYDSAALLAGRIQSPARRYVGLYASYEITPLLKSVNYFVANLDDRSRFFSPTLIRSVKPNLDWTLGVQWYGGAAGSEFGRFRPLFFTQVQYFF